MSKKRVAGIIIFILLGLIIGGYYLYNNYRINSLNQLIDELNMINEQQAAISNTNKDIVEDRITTLETFTTKEAMQKTINDIRDDLSKYREKMNNLKNGIKTDKAIEYINNYIARKNLYIDMILIYMDNMESYVNDNGLNTLTDEEYGILVEKNQKDTEEIEQQLKGLENKKTELEKELSILLQQQITLN